MISRNTPTGFVAILRNLIQQAGLLNLPKEITIVTRALNSPELKTLLLETANKGYKINLILGKNACDESEGIIGMGGINRENISELLEKDQTRNIRISFQTQGQEREITLRSVDPGELHAKCTIIGGRFTIIGSDVYDVQSTHNSGEIRAAIDSTAFAQDCLKRFQSLFDHAIPARLFPEMSTDVKRNAIYQTVLFALKEKGQTSEVDQIRSLKGDFTGFVAHLSTNEFTKTHPHVVKELSDLLGTENSTQVVLKKIRNETGLSSQQERQKEANPILQELVEHIQTLSKEFKGVSETNTAKRALITAKIEFLGQLQTKLYDWVQTSAPQNITFSDALGHKRGAGAETEKSLGKRFNTLIQKIQNLFGIKSKTAQLLEKVTGTLSTMPFFSSANSSKGSTHTSSTDANSAKRTQSARDSGASEHKSLE